MFHDPQVDLTASTSEPLLVLCRAKWRRRKGCFTRRVPRTVDAPRAARSMRNPMVHNTGCTALLAQGSEVDTADALPP